jgi:hypothetical protein
MGPSRGPQVRRRFRIESAEVSAVGEAGLASSWFKKYLVEASARRRGKLQSKRGDVKPRDETLSLRIYQKVHRIEPIERETEGNLMRKFLIVAAVAGLVLAVAAPAMALDFKFGSEYRVRFFAYNGINSADVPQTAFNYDDRRAAGNISNPRGVQIRIRPRFDASDDNGNIRATLRLEVGDVTWGAGGGAGSGSGAVQGLGSFGTGTANTARIGPGTGGSLGNDGVNVETKWAYIDFAMPWGWPARVRAGIQDWFLPKGMILDDDATGVKIYGSIKPISYELWWLRAFDGTTHKDDNADIYGVKVDLALAPWLNPGLYVLYGENKANAPTAPVTSRHLANYFFGLTATGKAGILSYDADFVYGISDGGPDGRSCTAANCFEWKGWTLDGHVGFPIGPLGINLAGMISSGDGRDGGTIEAFPWISPSYNGPGGGAEVFWSGGAFDVNDFQDAPTNTWSLGGWVTYAPVKALSLKAHYFYIGMQRKAGNACAGQVAVGTVTAAVPSGAAGFGYCKLAGRSSIGSEIGLLATYTVWTGFRVQGFMGWVIPTARAADPAAEYILQLYYNF